MLTRTFLSVSAFVVIAACDDAGVDYEAPEAIVLECTNELDKGTEREDWVSIIRVYPDNEYQTALQYFHFEDQRWFQPCRERGSECQLSVTPRFIQEIEGRSGWQVVTEINRTSGRITRTIYNDMPELEDKVIEDGVCRKTEEPMESKTKF